jgi:hypothetical protein
VDWVVSNRCENHAKQKQQPRKTELEWRDRMSRKEVKEKSWGWGYCSRVLSLHETLSSIASIKMQKKKEKSF